MPLKGQMMMTSKRHAQGDQPSPDVCQQRAPCHGLDQQNDGHPVHSSSHAAHGNEPQRANRSNGHFLPLMNQSYQAHAGAMICLCADDFGLHEGINHAVIRLISMERLHATGALVGAPAWKSGARQLRSLHASSTVDVGLHLDFTECPLTLDRRGLPPLIFQSGLGRLDRQAVRTEIRAQLNAFEQEMGAAPHFVDGHQHVHQFSVIREELLQELGERYSRNPPWVRNTHRRALSSNGTKLTEWLKAMTIAALGGAAMSQAAQRQGFAQNTALLGVYDFQASEARYLQLLESWLKSARHGDLLMCHPGRGLGDASRMSMARETEYQVLVSPRFGQLLQELHITLGPMSGILRANGTSPRQSKARC